MSIADKLTTIAENEIKVYEAGIEDGKQAEYDRFWNNYTGLTGGGADWRRKFANPSWTDEIFNPPFTKIKATVYAGCMFQNSGIANGLKKLTEIDVSETNVSSSSMSSFANSAINCRYFPIMKFPPNCDLNLSFAYNASLVTIEEMWVYETNTFSNTFTNDTLLENIKIRGTIGSSINFQWCPLTKESITSVVNALSATATGKTVTFKKTAKEAAFTADEWAALIATKSNWTISLV